jgi:hypothetical protein
MGCFPDALQRQRVLCMTWPVVVGVEGALGLHKRVWRMVCLAAIFVMDLEQRIS